MINLTICSMILLVACGTIFCLPAKYPFKTLEIETKGKVRAKAIIIGLALGSFKRLTAKKSFVKKITNTKTRLMLIIKNAALVSILIDLPLFSETSLDIEIGIASVAIVSNKEYVGTAIEYKLIPYSPIILV